MHTLRSKVAFRLEYVLYYQFYAKITTFFDQEKFGMAPLLYVDVEIFGGKGRENDVAVKNEVKISYWHHAQESSYTPHVRQHFLAPIGFTEILVGYAKMFILGAPRILKLYELEHDKINKITYAPSKDSNPPRLIWSDSSLSA